MSDRSASFARSRPGRFMIKRLGLPDPPRLRRHRAGEPVVAGPVLLGGAGRLTEPIGKLLQTVGAPAAKPVGDVGWNGSEIVAFRLHLPSKIRYHNTGREVGRGNILVWEQRLTDRLRNVPVVYAEKGDGVLDARMEAQSILYTTLWLFGLTFVAVAVVFGGVIVWVMRKGRRNTPGG